MTVKGKGGRPRIVIDWAEVDKLLGLQCTSEEIAGFLGVDNDTFISAIKRKHNMSFSEYYTKKGHSGKISLRRRQYQAAKDGNVTMLIWLGKQWLGQRDKRDVDNTSSDGSMTTLDMSKLTLDQKRALLAASKSDEPAEP